MHHSKDRETPRGAMISDKLLKEIIGLLEPPIDFPPPMKILNWNCQGGR